MTDLLTQNCRRYEQDEAPLSGEVAAQHLSEVPGWKLEKDRNGIVRSFDFKNYYETMAFVNAMAWIAHREDHHPDIEVSYKRCLVHYTTHAIGGLSMNDFICAAKATTLFMGL